MKKVFFILFAASLMLFVTPATAQSNADATTQSVVKGDINEDGRVDIGDINAVIEIMAENGTIETRKYYWYAGWTEPTAENIATIVNETYPATNTDSTLNKAGGSTTNINEINADYTKNKLFDNAFLTTWTERQYYVVVPQGCQIYSSIGNPSTAFTIHQTEIANHTVYISKAKSIYINAIKIY